MYGDAFFFECGNDLEEVECALPAGDTTGQGNDEFAAGLGEFFSPVLEPFG